MGCCQPDINVFHVSVYRAPSAVSCMQLLLYVYRKLLGLPSGDSLSASIEEIRLWFSFISSIEIFRQSNKERVDKNLELEHNPTQSRCFVRMGPFDKESRV